jgi:tRNA threonylcarbamoyladenosine biosynthesis protein TsaB
VVSVCDQRGRHQAAAVHGRAELDGRGEEMNTNSNNPLILALDTSQPTLCVALLRGSETLASVVDNFGAPHSQRLFPLLHELLTAHSLTPTDFDLLAVNTGPGSFTGLRVGLAAVKGLAATLGKSAFGVNALDALALATGETDLPIATFLNASRGELFGGVRWVEADGMVRALGDDCVGSIEMMRTRLLAQFAASEIVLTGDGAEMGEGTLRLNTERWRLIAAPNSLAPTIGRAAWWRWQAWALPAVTAYYIRPSEAEIKYGK